MNPIININNLSAEDAAAILELSPILDIAFVKAIGSSDRKFYVETTQGEKRMLVVFKNEPDWLEGGGFRIYDYIAAAGINTMRGVSKGTFGDGTLSYELYTWLDGENLFNALPRMSHAEQFATGKKAGAFLRKLHTLPPLWEPESWEICYWRKVKETIQFYNDKSDNPQGVDLLVWYLQDNRELLNNRPQTFTHGDWTTDNSMLSPNGEIGLIDIGSICNDPWSDFWQICGDSYAYFFTGHVKGYFEGEPPPEFFPLLAYYIAEGTLAWWPKDAQCVVDWFDDMRNPMPNWYLSQIE
ncbi:MAG: phosphotransferase [Oscillospiraceae bacterium]|nr:phosphotransferase [Oscillospiraceae bacterium]